MLNIAKATAPYNAKTYKLISEVYTAISKNYTATSKRFDDLKRLVEENI